MVPSEAAGFTSVFPGLPKPGPKKERGSRIPCHIPGPSSAGLSDLSALHVFWDMKKESSMECAGYSRTIIYSLDVYYEAGTGKAAYSPNIKSHLDPE